MTEIPDTSLQSGVSSADLFVGRDQLLADLVVSLERARAGRGNACWLVGEAGIGKTRTCHELARRASGFRVRHARCHEDRGSPAFWPWIQILREGRQEQAPATDFLDGARGILRLLPDMAEPSAAQDPHSTESMQERFLVFDSIVRHLVRQSEEEPLLLIFDDLHWSDRSSLLLLDLLVREIHDARILIVGTYRGSELGDEVVADLVAALSGRPWTQEVSLRPLDRDATAAIVHSITASEPSEGLIDQVYALTEGNPFFIEQVSRILTDETRASSIQATRLSLPRGVLHSIRRRLRQLDSDCVRILRCASVIGREFSLATLQTVMDIDLDYALGSLAQAQSTGLIREADVASRWRFTHALIQTAVYEELKPFERAQLHARVGQVLESEASHSGATILTDLAFHFAAAIPIGSVERALVYARRAGLSAVASLAYEQGVLHLERALKLSESSSHFEVRAHIDLMLDLANAHQLASNAEEAAKYFDRAFDLAQEAEMTEAMARAALGHCEVSDIQGGIDDVSIRQLETTLALVGDRDNPTRAKLLSRLAAALRFRPDATEVDELSREAIAMARRLGDPGTLAYTLVRRYWVAMGPERLDDRGEVVTEIFELAERAGDPWMDLEGRAFYLVGLIERGDLQRFDAELEVFAAKAARLKHPRHLWSVPRWQSLRAAINGEFERAEQCAGEALEVGANYIKAQALHAYAAQIGAIRREQGRQNEAVELIREHVRRYPTLWAWRCCLASIEAELGNLAAARAELDAVAGIGFEKILRGPHGLVGLTYLAEAVRRLRHTQHAASMYELLRPHAGVLIETGVGLFALGTVDHFLGLLAEAREDRGAAIAHFREALRISRRIGARPWTARALLACSNLLDHGDPAEREEARQMRAEGIDQARALGMNGMLREARHGAVEVQEGESGVRMLCREGDSWMIRFDGRTSHVRHQLGMSYLAALVGHPGRDFHAAALVAMAAQGGRATPRVSDAGPLLDEKARQNYQARLNELRAEIDEASACNDVGRVELLRQEEEALSGEIRRAVGLGGRSRRASSQGERARINVTRTIRAAVRRIRSADPALAEHLDATIRTGTFLSYRPDPRAGLAWQVRLGGE